MGICHLHLGSNLGNARELINEAIEKISHHIGPVVATSSLYRTEAWGVKEQPDFFNKSIAVEHFLSPEKLLVRIQKIEFDLGRNRSLEQKWGPRTMDIDILLMDNTIIDTPRLTIPHKLMAQRNFVLVPLAELIPDFVHPVLGKTIEELKNKCKDRSKVVKVEQ